MPDEIKLPSTVTGWALSIVYSALMGMFIWVLSLDREVSRIAATQRAVIEADKVLRDALTQEILNRREDMAETRRSNEALRELLMRHAESSNGKR